MVAPAAARVPWRRCVVLGASNVARNLSLVIAAARRSLGTPLDFVAAMGHGRGYGMESMVLGRRLCAVLDCGLWSALDARAPLPTVAVLTDVGNDLIYGASPAQVSGWLETCLQRVRTFSDRIIITGLPVEAVRQLGVNRFLFFRTLFFPSSRLTFDRALGECLELDQRVRALAERYQARFITPAANWYGWDPVHIRRSRAAAAWMTILSPAVLSAGIEPLVALRRTWSELRAAWQASPLERHVFGVPLHRRQPSAHLHDGTSISLF